VLAPAESLAKLRRPSASASLNSRLNVAAEVALSAVYGCSIYLLPLTLRRWDPEPNSHQHSTCCFKAHFKLDSVGSDPNSLLANLLVSAVTQQRSLSHQCQPYIQPDFFLVALSVPSVQPLLHYGTLSHGSSQMQALLQGHAGSHGIVLLRVPGRPRVQGARDASAGLCWAHMSAQPALPVLEIAGMTCRPERAGGDRS
jgi:hypothetical protein